MKSKLKILVLILATVSLASCVTLNSGSYSNSGLIMSKNFDYVKSDAVGKSSTNYILGLFGGSSKEALIADAKANLSKQYPLKANQAYVNTTVNTKSTLVLMGAYLKVECVVTADIVEFK